MPHLGPGGQAEDRGRLGDIAEPPESGVRYGGCGPGRGADRGAEVGETGRCHRPVAVEVFGKFVVGAARRGLEPPGLPLVLSSGPSPVTGSWCLRPQQKQGVRALARST